MKEITITPVLQTFATGILPYSATLMAFSATAHQLKTLGVKMNLQYAPFCQEVYSPRCLLFTQNAGQQNWLQALCNAGMALELSLLYLLDLGSADLPVVFRWVSDIQYYAVLQCPSLQAPLPRLLAGRGGARGGLLLQWRHLGQ